MIKFARGLILWAAVAALTACAPEPKEFDGGDPRENLRCLDSPECSATFLKIYPSCLNNPQLVGCDPDYTTELRARALLKPCDINLCPDIM